MREKGIEYVLINVSFLAFIIVLYILEHKNFDNGESGLREEPESKFAKTRVAVGLV